MYTKGVHIYKLTGIKRKFMRILITLFLFATYFNGFTQSKYNEVTPIKTKNGFMIIYNFEKSKFTIRIEGDDARPASQPYVFFVDNRALQITIVDIKDIDGLDTCKTNTDSLVRHMSYELDYLSGVLKNKLEITSKELLNISSGTFLFWYFSLPKELNAELEKQFYLTTIIGDKLIMLKTASERKEKVKDLKDYLEKYSSTIKYYPKGIDIDEIIEGVKKE